MYQFFLVIYIFIISIGCQYEGGGDLLENNGSTPPTSSPDGSPPSPNPNMDELQSKGFDITNITEPDAKKILEHLNTKPEDEDDLKEYSKYTDDSYNDSNIAETHKNYKDLKKEITDKLPNVTSFDDIKTIQDLKELKDDLQELSDKKVDDECIKKITDPSKVKELKENIDKIKTLSEDFDFKDYTTPDEIKNAAEDFEEVRTKAKNFDLKEIKNKKDLDDIIEIIDDPIKLNLEILKNKYYVTKLKNIRNTFSNLKDYSGLERSKIVELNTLAERKDLDKNIIQTKEDANVLVKIEEMTGDFLDFKFDGVKKDDLLDLHKYLKNIYDHNQRLGSSKIKYSFVKNKKIAKIFSDLLDRNLNFDFSNIEDDDQVLALKYAQRV